jgi:hypothetical protein
MPTSSYITVSVSFSINDETTEYIEQALVNYFLSREWKETLKGLFYRENLRVDPDSISTRARRGSTIIEVVGFAADVATIAAFVVPLIQDKVEKIVADICNQFGISQLTPIFRIKLPNAKTPPQPESNSKTLFLLIGAVAFLLLLVTLLVGYILGRERGTDLAESGTPSPDTTGGLATQPTDSTEIIVIEITATPSIPTETLTVTVTATLTPTETPSPTPTSSLTPTLEFRGPFRPHTSFNAGTGVLSNATRSDGLHPLTIEDLNLDGHFEIQNLNRAFTTEVCLDSVYDADLIWIIGSSGLIVSLNGEEIAQLTTNAGGSHGFVAPLTIQFGDQICVSGNYGTGYAVVWGPDIYYHYDSYCYRDEYC